MPHVIYVHSNLTQGRIVPATEDEAHRVFAFEQIDVVVAMGLAGLVNMAMLFMAARVFHETGHPDVAASMSAYQTLCRSWRLLPRCVRAFTGDFGHRQLRTWDAGGSGGDAGLCELQDRDLAVAAGHDDPRDCGDLSGPGPDATLVIEPGGAELHAAVSGDHADPVHRNRELMGSLVNRRSTTVLAIGCAAVILTLNAALVYQTFGGVLPGF